MTTPWIRPLSTPLALAAAFVLGSARAVEPAAPAIDGKPVTLSPSTSPVDYTWREAPMNSMGIKSLSDLRGKPVLIDFWGRN